MREARYGSRLSRVANEFCFFPNHCTTLKLSQQAVENIEVQNIMDKEL